MNRCPRFSVWPTDIVTFLNEFPYSVGISLHRRFVEWVVFDPVGFVESFVDASHRWHRYFAIVWLAKTPEDVYRKGFNLNENILIWSINSSEMEHAECCKITVEGKIQ